MIVNCNMCGRMFRSERRLNKHIMKGKCKSMKDRKAIVSKDGELVILPREYPEHQYIGREYNYNPIPTANRHYRTGIPLPRLSKYSRSAI